MMKSQLITLLEVVRQGSFINAAKKLSMAQPTVSYQIRQLEDEYGIRIFHRLQRNMHLTEEGKILVQYARRMEVLELRLRQEIQDSLDHMKHLFMGMTPGCMETPAEQMISVFCRRHPEISIRMTTGSLQDITGKTDICELDMILTDMPVCMQHLRKVLLGTDDLCVIMSSGHASAFRQSMSLADLKNERLILRSEEAGSRKILESVLQNHGEDIRDFDVMLEMDSLSGIRELVLADLGVTVMAESAFREELASGKMLAVGIRGMRMTREVSLFFHEDFHSPEWVEELRMLYRTPESVIHPFSPA